MAKVKNCSLQGWQSLCVKAYLLKTLFIKNIINNNT